MNKQKYLFVVEKPSLKKILEKSFKKNKNKIDYDIDIVISNNCVVDLYEPALRSSVDRLREEPILKLQNREIDERYRVVLGTWREKCGTIISQKIKTNEYDAIVNACDPDEEGELTFAYTIESLQLYGLRQKRFDFLSLSDAELRERFLNFE